jgi:hypothetical protein
MCFFVSFFFSFSLFIFYYIKTEHILYLYTTHAINYGLSCFFSSDLNVKNCDFLFWLFVCQKLKYSYMIFICSILLFISCDRYFFSFKVWFHVCKTVLFCCFLGVHWKTKHTIRIKNWITLFRPDLPNSLQELKIIKKKTLSPTTVRFFLLLSLFVCPISSLSLSFFPYILFLCVFSSFVKTFFFLFVFLSCCCWLIFLFSIHQAIRKKETHKIWRF